MKSYVIHVVLCKASQRLQRGMREDFTTRNTLNLVGSGPRKLRSRKNFEELPGVGLMGAGASVSWLRFPEGLGVGTITESAQSYLSMKWTCSASPDGHADLTDRATKQGGKPVDLPSTKCLFQLKDLALYKSHAVYDGVGKIKNPNPTPTM